LLHFSSCHVQHFLLNIGLLYTFLTDAASKDGRIEELVQQHHLDRVKIHELHEKTSSFDTEMASLKSALSHEQAHRQRLEARLRSLMSTPDFAAEGLNGE
jgi:chromosome segregation ATPase